MLQRVTRELDPDRALLRTMHALIEFNAIRHVLDLPTQVWKPGAPLKYRGYGPSEGTSSERGLERDARAAYAWLRQRTAADKIVPFGESVGGGPATWLARFYPVGGLILLSTSTSTPALFGHFMPWLPTDLLVRTRFDNLRRVKSVTAPKLFIHSRRDEIVPFEMAEALWTAAPSPKRHLWIDGVGHNETFYKARSEATQAIRDFLSAL